MFYFKKDFWYTFLKSDLDKFWIWPFDRKLEDNEIKEILPDFKTYKHIWGLWNQKKYVFEYKKNWLNLVYNEFENYSEKQIDIFVVNKIWETDFIDENKFISFFKEENFNIKNIIHWWFLQLSEKEFIDKLPILNWFVNKFWFLHQVNLPVSRQLVFLENIYEFDLDAKKIEKIPTIISEIEDYLNSWKLLTNSKKEYFLNKIQDAIYLLICWIIKIYFIIFHAVKNRQQLDEIVEWEYQAYANLLKEVSGFHIEKLLNRLNFMLEQITLLEKFFRHFLQNKIW